MLQVYMQMLDRFVMAVCVTYEDVVWCRLCISLLIVVIAVSHVLLHVYTGGNHCEGPGRADIIGHRAEKSKEN